MKNHPTILHALAVSKHQDFGHNSFHKYVPKSRNTANKNIYHSWPKSLGKQAANHRTQHINIHLGLTHKYYIFKGISLQSSSPRTQCSKPERLTLNMHKSNKDLYTLKGKRMQPTCMENFHRDCRYNHFFFPSFKLLLVVLSLVVGGGFFFFLSLSFLFVSLHLGHEEGKGVATMACFLLPSL